MRELEKAQRMLLRLRKVLLDHYKNQVPLAQCSGLGSDLGMDSSAGVRFVELNSNIFRIVDDQRDGKCVAFTKLARQLVDEEFNASRDPYYVYVVRKLLMLCKVEYLSTEQLMRNRCFKFPRTLADDILAKKPGLFHWDRRPRRGKGGIRLVSWDEQLAVPDREKTLRMLQSSLGNQAVTDDELSKVGVPVETACGLELVLPAKQLLEVHKQPLISPYDRAHFCVGNAAVERRRKIGVIHEFLSLVRLKSATLLDLIDLGEELQLGDPNLLEQFLKKEKEFFIVREIEGTNYVFLREGYEWDHSSELRPRLLARRKLLDLVNPLEQVSMA